MADLVDLRNSIDRIDDEILRLFGERTKVAGDIAEYKLEHNMRVYDPAREREKVADAQSKVPEDMSTYAQVLMELLMEASRQRQNETLGARDADDTLENIDAARQVTPALFPPTAVVACQGVEGAYSQIACDRFFKHPMISYFSSFESVFRAVEEGFCDYGVLPIENSTAGSVNKVYDLMIDHSFHIIRSTRLKIDHNLLAKPGTRIEDVRDVFSHEQAINQCSEYLAAHPNMRVHVCENTAIAAQRVADSGRNDVAALSSMSCASLYNLEVLESDVQDRDNNYTRFACISKNLEIYPGANRTSLMIVVSHEPGMLYKVLAKFYALDINVLKLESRPIPGRDFEFMFYFDIDCSVDAPEFRRLMATIGSICQEYRYLGSYTEVV